MNDVAMKPYLSYADQVALLRSRGMLIDDEVWAEEVLATHNYYRLSGYWYSARSLESPKNSSVYFKPGTSLALCVALYDFDAQLRSAVFTSLAPIELTLRALLGHHLGKIDPLIHTDENKLHSVARRSTTKGST